MALHDLEVRINGDSSGFQRAVRETQDGAESAERTIERLDSAVEDLGDSTSEALSGLTSAMSAASSAFSEAQAQIGTASAIIAESAAEADSALGGITQAESEASAAGNAFYENIIAVNEIIEDNETAAEALAETIAETEEAAENFNDTLGDTADPLEETENGADRTRESVDGLGRSLGETSESADSAAEALGRLGRTAGGLILIQKAITGVLSCFKEYADYESSVIRVSDIFGESADAITQFAQTTAKSLGMAESSAYKYAAVYGNLFKGITSDTEENSKVTLAMLSASATAASKTGRTMDDVMERIRSGLLGNTEAIEDLGIYVNVAMLETTEAFRKMADGRSWEQLEYQEQQQIRILAILEQANKQFGTGVSQNTVTSISTLSGAFSDLKISIGELASGGLTPLVQSLTVVVQGVNSAVKWVGTLSGTSKTYLGIAAALALGIPAVTLAAKGLALAQAGLHAVQAILIPQTITFGTVLKSAFGWISLAALAIGALYAIMEKNNTAKGVENVDDYSSALKNTKNNADSASESLGRIKDSTEELSNEIKKALAGFDELNVLNSDGSMNSTSILGFDTSGIDNAAEALSAFSDMNYDIDFDTNAAETTFGIKGLFSEMWSNIKTSFKDWTRWWKGLGADMYTGIHDGDWEPLLTRLDEKVRDFFGDKWSDFWQEAGSNMYTGIKDGDWEPLLTQFDNWMRNKFGDRWSDFWTKKGEQLYDGFHTGSTKGEKILNGLDTIIRFTTFGQRWSDFWQDRGEKIYDAFEKAKEDTNPVFAAIYAGAEFVFGSDWTSFWEEVGGDIYDAINGNSEGVYSALTDLNDKVRSLFGEDWTNFWEGVGEALYDAFNPEINKVEHEISENGRIGSKKYISQDTIGGALSGASNLLFQFQQTLPHAAKGGVVARATNLIAGEAGAEAIVPLENNTGWIDKIAEKISASVPSGASGDIIVRLEVDGREFRQAVVKAVEMDKARRGG